MEYRIGEGIDRHRLVAERPLTLGGVTISHSHGLQGHSDGDALLHAVCDALLGAAALGDLGALFSDQDHGNRDRDSREFVREVARRVRAAGFEVGNVDATIMAETPSMAPHVAAMRANIAADLQADVGQISVKATRGEGLGPEGRGEAITVRAVTLLRTAPSSGDSG